MVVVDWDAEVRSYSMVIPWTVLCVLVEIGLLYNLSTEPSKGYLSATGKYDS